jgi:TPR repeat protein
MFIVNGEIIMKKTLRAATAVLTIFAATPLLAMEAPGDEKPLSPHAFFGRHTYDASALDENDTDLMKALAAEGNLIASALLQAYEFEEIALGHSYVSWNPFCDEKVVDNCLQAISFYEKARDAGHPQANTSFAIGRVYDISKNHPCVMDAYEEAYLGGHPEAAGTLGNYFYSVMNDPRSAADWFKKAMKTDTENAEDWASYLELAEEDIAYRAATKADATQ